MKRIAENLFAKKIQCKHGEFLISRKDVRIKEIPQDKKEIHSCEEIKIWQEPAQMKRYFMYESLLAIDINQNI